MRCRTTSKLAAAAATLVIGSAGYASDLTALYESACGSVGIDADRCSCIAQQVIEQHGEDAARYVALDMNLRYDEAAAALERAGEDAAFAASETFEEAQHKACSSGRLARQQGQSTGGGSAGAVSSSAVAAEQQAGRPATTIDDVFDPAQPVPVIDLSANAAGGVIDVSASFGGAALASASSRNLRNFIGFYAVVDASGGIDTDGDGVANVGPGDDGYSATAQGRALPNKLYWNASGGNDQYLGEVRLPGGKRYAPLVMYRSGRPSAVPTLDVASMRNQVLQGMSANANLYFAFANANADKQSHVGTRDSRSFLFEHGEDEIVVIVDGLTLD